MRIFCPTIVLILSILSICAHAAPVNQNLDSRENLPAWIQGEVDNPAFFTKKDRQAYAKKLWGVKLGAKLQVTGSHNFAIYSLTGYGLRFKSSSLIMKVFNAVDNAAIGEAKALRAVGDLVASGTVSALGSKPAIIMKKKAGQPLQETEAYKNAREVVREMMRNQTFTLMCDKMAIVATKKYVLHGDNHPSHSNTLVTLDKNTVKSVELVDYGPPKTYFLTKSVTKAEVVSDILTRRVSLY
ncbi:hypothetical protein C8R41DRAFT_330234 [Lentinula lateritia]|uniref:Aminoglycoside phosphotransferase domain-containing protein n=1 Tax=Lentinula lateritia TaxID=40482 RepID=A0ABQ8VGL5_9AGAR|nr:hypothetical protein C8R41DRAFT_330234 [Lentinula lateritia]